jgi:LuxR family transcriptional regulator, maltose regulon positive regulatory protein
MVGLPFELLMSKLTAPRLRSEIVERPALIERLGAATGTPVVAVVAPAGYGKTTLLADWAKRNGQTFAWVSLDEQDNDPKVFLAYVAAALNAVEPIDPGVFTAIASAGASVVGVVTPRVARAFASMRRRVVLVLDDVQVLHNRQCQAAIAALVEHVPAESRIVIAARREPHLRLARLRAEGRILEIGPNELSFDRDQSASLLKNAGVEVSDAEVDGLHGKTEGWPVGLYLAALSLRAGGSVPSTVAAFHGDDQFVSEYLHFEVLSRLPQKEMQFLRRTAVLDRLSGPLCDAVLEETGSAEILARMERSNQLVVALDHRSESYRYHHLFQEMLTTDLERTEPELKVPMLRRAADWCERNEKPEEAVEYAISAGDDDRVARLLGALTLPLYRTGRMSTIQRWCGWLQNRRPISRYPLVAVQASWFLALTGHPAEAERLSDATERGLLETPGSSDEIALAESLGLLLRTALCRYGVEAMRVDAEDAVAKLGETFATPALFLGVAQLLQGDPESADRAFEESAELGQALGQTVDEASALAERSLLAADQLSWEQAERLAAQAQAVVLTAHLEDYSTSALAYVAAARVSVHDGDAATARRNLVQAQLLRTQLTQALPHFAVQVRLELARAYIRLDEVAGARTLIREIREIFKYRPDLGVLVKQTEELRSQVSLQGSWSAGSQSLTAAELRLLPLLSTHFSFREIGEELYVSQHTVKSQAISIYRKLGVSSRSDAIQQAREIGLLEG